MGAIISKIVHQVSEPKTIQLPGTIFEDPRSPTEGVQRTPLSNSKKPYLETDIDNVTPTLPLRVRLLKRVADPRSPTVGINRTPLSLVASDEFDSPVSLYSDYQDELESFSCMPSPAEPSVNVSDFENDQFAKELDSLVNQLNVSLSDRDSPEPHVPLTLRPDKSALSLENKKMCEGLIQEIIDSFKECEEELSKAPEKLLQISDTPPVNNLKIKKSRKPLANITSAGNTPIKYKTKKDGKLVRVANTGENSPLAVNSKAISAGNTPIKHKIKKDAKLVRVEMTGENSPVVAKANGRIQWDQDATIII